MIDGIVAVIAFCVGGVIGLIGYSITIHIEHKKYKKMLKQLKDFNERLKNEQEK